MKNVLRSLASAFVEIDDTPKPSPPVVTKQTPAHPAIISLGGTADVGEVNTFMQQFDAILSDENKRNFPGNDWFEFNVMKNAMSAIPQESIKYEAAFAGWMIGGNQTKKSLLDTAHIYLGLIDKEIQEFGDAFKQQHSLQVGKNEQLIEQKTAKIQELTNQIATLNSEVNVLRGNNEAATRTLTVKKEAFDVAGQAKRQELLDEINKINQYIN